MKSIAFVIPYFGRFPSYFDKWLKSCSYNSTIDWIIFTDCHEEYDYPINVHVNYCTFEDMKVLFQSKFDFKISLNKPYKLCDYKCAYGYIFEKELEKYDFWGYCDVDLIWGNLRQFISDEMLNEYDRVGLYGHCSIIKNKKELKELFMKNVEGVPNYRWVYSSSMSFCFDETQGLNKIFSKTKKTMVEIPAIFDVDMKRHGFVPMHSEAIDFDIQPYYFIFREGELIIKGLDSKDEHNISYAHFQKRDMKDLTPQNNSCYYIFPNEFSSNTENFNPALCSYYSKIRFEWYKLKFNIFKEDLLGHHKFYHHKYRYLHKISWIVSDAASNVINLLKSKFDL